MPNFSGFFKSIANREQAYSLFKQTEKTFGKFADTGDEYINRIGLFDFDHPHHPYNCEINDPADLFPAPHEGRINIIVNAETQGPEITWLLKMMKEDVVYAFARVMAIESFFADAVFQYDPESDEWVHLEKESDAFKEIVRDIRVLQTLAK